LHRLKTTLFLAFLIAILYTPTASAQATAAKISVVSGNGQIFTTDPFAKPGLNVFHPMVVKVTDVNGNPIAGKTVNWQWVGSPTGGSPALPLYDTTVTDANGISSDGINQAGQNGNVQQPYLQSHLTATVDGLVADFWETQALLDSATGNRLVYANTSWTDLNNPGVPPTLTGPAGSIGTVPIQVHIDGGSSLYPIQNISVRLLNAEVTTASGQVIVDPTLPSASCVTGAGADPGSVLTDANGNATCYPVFGPVAGKGPVSVLVAGLDPANFDYSNTSYPLPGPIAFQQFTGVQLVVTPVIPGLVSIVSGNNQSVNPGQASAPLVVKVTDQSGAVTIANTTVQWAVTPAGAATLSRSQSTTDSQGQAQTTVIFSPTASGPITVRAALTGGNSGISTVFSLSTNVLISALSKVSGDLQTTQSGQNFATPLGVLVTGTNGIPLSNQPISFQVASGTATLSANSALTDGNGQAQITVKAGSTPGTVKVNAFIQTFSQTFTLTIIPPGPALSNSSFYNAGGGTRIGALSPCSLVTVIASGLAPNVQGLVVNTNGFGPWSTTLASDTVTVNNVLSPISSVGNVNGVEQLTFQVPCETVPANSVPITINVGGGTGTITFPVVAASPGIFETVMSDGVRRAVVIRPDGSFVSLQNPARRGETVRVFVTGLGKTAPAMVTGALPFTGSDSLVLGQVIVGVNNGGTPMFTSRASPNLLGVFEVAFQVPSDAPTGNDVVLSVSINAVGDTQTSYSNGSKLPIQ
jgi:uncharacterized protein (TIGR03437 family)